MYNAPTKMTVNAVAVWDEHEQQWCVSVLSTYEGASIHGVPMVETNASVQRVAECDEVVIPWAILHHNGINPDALLKD